MMMMTVSVCFGRITYAESTTETWLSSADNYWWCKRI